MDYGRSLLKLKTSVPTDLNHNPLVLLMSWLFAMVLAVAIMTAAGRIYAFSIYVRDWRRKRNVRARAPGVGAIRETMGPNSAGES